MGITIIPSHMYCSLKMVVTWGLMLWCGGQVPAFLMDLLHPGWRKKIAPSSSRTLLSVWQTIWHHSPEVHNFYIYHCENLRYFFFCQKYLLNVVYQYLMLAQPRRYFRHSRESSGSAIQVNETDWVGHFFLHFCVV